MIDMMKLQCGACLLVLLLFCLPALAQGAVVDNGSDPGSRLNMRTEPSRDASSIGRFYSGTEVEIEADAGDGWSEVTLGGGQNSVSGYMMTSYLSTDGSGVLDATFSMEVTSPYGTQSVVLRNCASNSYDAVAMLTVGDTVRVIGGAGSFYYVQLNDDTVGCLSTEELK